MAKSAIVKFVNYPDAGMEKSEKVAKYICSPSRTESKLIFSHCLDRNDVTNSFHTIENRWQPKGTRLFKHGIFSFGDPKMDPTKAVQITKDVLDIFNCYPWLAAVHINCPQRVHTHFLLGCIDLRTGRKLSQSKRDLLQFKEHYNSIAKKHGIPLVRGYGLEQPQSLAEEDVSNEIVSDVVTIDSSPLYVTNYPNPVTPPPHQGNDAGSILTDFKKDFAMYFSFGYGRSG